MKKIKLKQGTLAWEKARESRIGSSEIFDIVKYYSSAEELQNCGIDTERFIDESPYTSVWALYHKMINSGFYAREALAPEFAEYGHAVEGYGLKILQRGRIKNIKQGEVFADERLIVSLDLSGISEEIDVKPFDYGNGIVPIGRPFVCEQKSMFSHVVKNGLPYKYLIQAQYQITKIGASFFIIQLIVLNNDTVFERGKITQMSLQKRFNYLNANATVSHVYINNNAQMSQLINVCIERFLNDVENRNEPLAFIENDKQSDIIKSIRANTFFSDKNSPIEVDLSTFINAKEMERKAAQNKKDLLQGFVELAKSKNNIRFVDPNGSSASFSSDGKFLVRQ